MMWDWHSLVLLWQGVHFRRLQNWQFKDVRMIFKGDLVQFLVHTMKMSGPFSSIIALMLALASATGSPITSKLSLPTLVISTLYSSPVLITDYHNSLPRLHHEFCKIRSICRGHLRRRSWPRWWPAGHNWGRGPCQWSHVERRSDRFVKRLRDHDHTTALEKASGFWLLEEERKKGAKREEGRRRRWRWNYDHATTLEETPGCTKEERKGGKGLELGWTTFRKKIKRH